MSNVNSHLTAKERDMISFPSQILFERNLLKGEVLDFGCGHGKDVEILKGREVNIEGYDPYYYNTYPSNEYDTILCIYVLNVLLPQDQTKVIYEISTFLKWGGTAYFAVRRDVQFPGYRMHKIHKEKTYQCNVVLPFKSIFRNEYVEIYEFQHYCYLQKGNSDVSPFFADNELKVQMGEIATAFAIEDKFPVSKGHTLIIPKRKVENYFDLQFQEQSACWFLVNLIKEQLINKYNPPGFNIGVNINTVAGQTVPHCHIHVIPRYERDVENPRGGVRGVIREKRDY